MKRIASAGLLVLTLALVGCPDAMPTSPLSRATQMAAELRRAGTDVPLRLYPRGFGKRAYAAWKAQEGRQDSEGDADHALWLQKMVPTATFSAGVAVIEGVEGLGASQITGLSWEHRVDGHCGAGAPRWNLNLSDDSGQPFTVFLGCAAAAHTAAGTDDQGREWIRDSYPGPAIGAQILAATGRPANAFTVRSLIIVFDEGNDLGFPGYVPLDNIAVEVDGQVKVFTGPMDNAR